MLLLNYFSAKVSALDAAVGKIVMSLRESGLYENSIIVFTADVIKTLQNSIDFHNQITCYFISKT